MTIENLRGHQATTGVSRLGFGMNFTGDLFLVVGVVLFVTDIGIYPRPLLGAIAWTLLLASAIVSQVIATRFPSRAKMLSPYLVVVWALVVLFSIAGSIGGTETLPYAAAATGAAILTIVTVRSARFVIICTVVLGAALLASLATTLHNDLLSLGPALVLVLLAVTLPLVGVTIVRSFRTLVQLELDRAQSASTVTDPRYAVGMLASEELAKLDLDAEQLLESVASGAVALPLPEEQSSRASTLATELRLHLIEGRRETWLYHAISESAILGPAVTLSDPLGLAGLLGRDQRDTLLSAIWLLLGDSPHSEQVLRVELDERDAVGAGAPTTLIVLEATGIPLARIDPATWQAVKRIGRHAETASSGGFRVEIECVVDETVDHQP